MRACTYVNMQILCIKIMYVLKFELILPVSILLPSRSGCEMNEMYGDIQTLAV